MTENLRVRTHLMGRIADIIARRHLKQREAAALFGTTQPRISDVVRGKGDEFTIDALVNMLASAGLPTDLARSEASSIPPGGITVPERDPVIEAYKPGVDRTLLRDSLRRTPTERVLSLSALQGVANEAAAAGRTLR